MMRLLLIELSDVHYRLAVNSHDGNDLTEDLARLDYIINQCYDELDAMEEGISYLETKIATGNDLYTLDQVMEELDMNFNGGIDND